MSFLEGVDVRRPGRVADLLARAMRQRAVGATATNEHSSRSHMVFSLNITGSNAASGQQVHGQPPKIYFTARSAEAICANCTFCTASLLSTEFGLLCVVPLGYLSTINYLYCCHVLS